MRNPLTLLRRFRRDRRANVAIEFALLSPLMFSTLFGAVELTNLMTLNRKVVAATQMLSDLVTQTRTVSTADLDDIRRAGELVLDPFPATGLRLYIASVTFNASVQPSLGWSYSANGGLIASPTALVSGLGTANGSVVITQIQYTYEPLFVGWITGPIEVQQRAFNKPRRSATVTRT